MKKENQTKQSEVQSQKSEVKEEVKQSEVQSQKSEVKEEVEQSEVQSQKSEVKEVVKEVVKEGVKVEKPAEKKAEVAKEEVQGSKPKAQSPEAVKEEKTDEAKPAKVVETRLTARAQAEKDKLDSWKPRTELGRAVRSGDVTNMSEALSFGKKVLEPEIVDLLLPNIESDLMLIGQAKGKFGGGQRRIFKQTQKKTAEGNVPSFTTLAVVGNKDGYVGLGMAGSKETVPARDKAIRNAKLRLIKIRRSCGSWACGCGTYHSIPFRVTGKCGSVRITLLPAPKGTGLCVEKECQKLLKLAGIKDVWSQTFGSTKTKSNLVTACFEALKQLMEIKLPAKTELKIIDGALNDKQ